MKAVPSPTSKLWHGVRMRRVAAAADPDAPSRPVHLPAAWDAAAASSVAALAGDDPADLPALAERWLAPLAAAGGLAMAARAQGWLLNRVAGPALAHWGSAPTLFGGEPGWVLHLAACDRDDLPDLAADCVATLAALAPAAPTLGIALTGLSGLLAAQGIDYDSAEARSLAARLVAALRDAAERQAARHGRAARLLVVDPGPIDALLGVETAGIAPAFSMLDGAGTLARAARAWLAARGMTPEAALASVLAGADPLPIPSPAAHAAMDAALRPLLDAMPALQPPLPAPARPALRQDLPARHGGTARKASVGGQKVYLRTGEYPDGRLGEVAITLPQASPAVRALADCLAHAISVGLQHGVPLREYVDALIGTRYGPAGAVEGDPAVSRATSSIDYVLRNLAATYLPGAALPPAETEGEEPPLLPLDLPQDAPRRRGLRLVT